ncbi:MAG: HNH endonuclease [Turicibacter sp.]|nr:HNH endonuclease [Turicibacter sp.]
MQNKTLYESNSNGVEIYLFEVFDSTEDKYIFMGQFELYGEPYTQKQFDKEGTLRNVCVFPLKPLDLNISHIHLRAELLRCPEITTIREKKNKQIRELGTEQLKKIARHEPKVISNHNVITQHYNRSPYIVEYAKRRAKGICELCEKAAPFNIKDGSPFLETHHIKWLSKGGEDSIENTVAVCPNCHRKLHHAPSTSDIEKLQQIDKFNLD